MPEIALSGTFKSFEGYVSCIAFSPNGRLLAICGKGRTISLYDVQSGQQVCVLGKHNGGVKSVSWSPDGHLLVSGGDFGNIKLWDIRTASQWGCDLKGHLATVNMVAFSPNGTLIASASGDLVRSDNTIRLWSATSGECVVGPLCGHSTCVRKIMFCPIASSALVLASYCDERNVCLWSAEDGSLLCELSEHEYAASCIAFCRIGTRLALGSWDGSVRIWDLAAPAAVAGAAALAATRAAADGSASRVMRGHEMPVSCVCFSPGGALVASGSWDSTVRVWEAATGRLQAGPWKAHAFTVWALAWSAGGGALASGGDDAAVRLWDPSDGQALPRCEAGPPGHTTQVQAVAFAPGGNAAASADRDGRVLMWDVVGTAARLALAMGAHPRLGRDSPLSGLERDLLAAVAAHLVLID